jgi:hypothetical protein
MAPERARRTMRGPLSRRSSGVNALGGGDCLFPLTPTLLAAGTGTGIPLECALLKNTKHVEINLSDTTPPKSSAH